MRGPYQPTCPSLAQSISYFPTPSLLVYLCSFKRNSFLDSKTIVWSILLHLLFQQLGDLFWTRYGTGTKASDYSEKEGTVGHVRWRRDYLVALFRVEAYSEDKHTFGLPNIKAEIF